MKDKRKNKWYDFLLKPVWGNKPISKTRQMVTTFLWAIVMPIFVTAGYSISDYLDSDEWTNSAKFKKHVKTDTQHQRSLTQNEINFLYDFGFQDSIQYQDVRIHISDEADDYFSKNSGIIGKTEGNIVVVPSRFRDDDYADEKTYHHIKITFLHEMVHVWQNQNCVVSPKPLFLEGMRHHFLSEILETEKPKSFTDRKLAQYAYKLDGQSDLIDYSMEAQASIMEDFYQSSLRNKSTVAQKEALKNFFNNPHYANKTCIPGVRQLRAVF